MSVVSHYGKHGELVYTEVLRKGVRHSLDKPAVVNYYRGKITSSHWYSNGLRHRKGDLPAREDIDGDYVTYTWYRYGEIYRWDGPAQISLFRGDILRERYYDNGKLCKETRYEEDSLVEYIWYKNGRIHRDLDMAAVIGKRSGVIVLMKWYKNGRIHRDHRNLPVVIEFYDKHQIKSAEWYIRGRHKRAGDLPTCVYFACTPFHEDYPQNSGYKDGSMGFPHGDVIEENWHCRGKICRKNDMPAVIKYKNNHVIEEQWRRHGIIHRDKLPAHIVYDNFNGDQNAHRPRTETYYTDGKICNKFGPSVVEFGANDTIREQYYIDGVAVSIDEWRNCTKQ
jgi:hypothetical protein